MTDARIARDQPDAFLAADLLARAKQFARDGTSGDLGIESRVVLLHNAIICACDAILAIEGRRIEGSVGGHKLRIEEAEKRLPGANSALFTTLDEARVSRNEVSYSAAAAPIEGIEATSGAVQRLIELADDKIEPHLPDWLRP